MAARTGMATTGLVIAGLWAVGAAMAAEPAPAAAQRRAAVLQSIVDCRPMQDEHQRLACYDKAAAQLDEAEAKGQVVVIDQEQARKVRREVFGLQLPSLDLFSGRQGSPAEENLERITEPVKTAAMDGAGRWTIVLQSGAVWRQIDSEDVQQRPHPGSTAEIRRAALGSFFMKLDGQRSIRVQRER